MSGEPDPFDVGAILRAAAEAAGMGPADLMRATGMAPQNIYRALASPDTRPVVARRILAALRHHVVAVRDRRR